MSEQKKILVCLPDTLLGEVDAIAEKERIHRSKLVREALQLYIKEKKREEIRTQLKEGYIRMGEINLEIAEKCFAADCMQNQSYEEKLAECE